MKRLIYIALGFTLSLSFCNPHDEEVPVARINNQVIYMREIDSMLEANLISYRINALNHLIILELLKQNIDNNRNLFLYYIDSYQNSITSPNLPLEDSILFKLKKGNDIRIFIPSPDLNTKKLEDLYSYSQNVEGAKNDVIILYDYCCPICSYTNDEIKQLLIKFKVNLKYVYYSHYVSVEALICDLAFKQNKFFEMRDSIMSKNCSGDLNDYLKMANSLGLDTIGIIKNLHTNNEEIIKMHLINQHVIEGMGIYSIPTYIYKNLIFHDIKSLELVLQETL